MRKFISNIQSPDLYTRLDKNKAEDTVIVNDNISFQEMYNDILSKQAQWEKISFWVGWGGAFGIVTYRLIKKLLDQGIKPDEFVANSVGSIISTLLVQWYTDEKYIDFFFSNIHNIKSLTPAYFLSRLIPFTVFLSEENRIILMEKNEIFQQYIEKRVQDPNEKMSENKLKELLSEFLWKEGWSPLGEKEWKKITFNDIKKQTGTTLAIQASVLSLEPRWMKKVKTTSLWDESERWNKGHQNNIRPITFRWSYPILDGIIASASPNFIKDTTVKWKQLKTTDGYWSGQNYPHKPSDFSSIPEWKNWVKIVFMTEDNFILTRWLSSDFRKWIKYVVRPDMRAGGAFDFSDQARSRFEKITSTILSLENQK